MLSFSFSSIAAAVITVSLTVVFGRYLKFRLDESKHKYNHYSTAAEIAQNADLSGKVCIVTGGNTGLGKETVKQLYSAGSVVIMACRNVEKAEKARNDIINSVKGRNSAKLIIIKLDLGDLKTVDEFVSTFKANGIVNKKLDFLINNAGVMAFPEFGTTVDGIERQFGINHIGHFYLTNKLLPILRANKTRVISLASRASVMANAKQMRAFLSDIEKGGPTSKSVPYNQWTYYGISKLCNILFTRQLNRLYNKDGIVALSLHPGGIMTELSRNMKFDFMIVMIFLRSFMYMKNIPQGTSTTLRCVTIKDSEVFGDKKDDVDNMAFYFNDCRAVRTKNYWAPTFAQKELKDMDKALWDRSVQIIQSLDYLKLIE